MRVPRSWLAEFVDVDLGLEDLVEAMSLHGLEVEAVRRPGADVRGARTARVVERAPHPDADQLQLVTVTDGVDELQVVCGAWNFDVGDVVLHAGVGASLPDAPRIEARDIRGVTSHGMLCSARELELGRDHSGIVVLPDDTGLGIPVRDLFPLGEPVIDVAVFSERGDQQSILGIAREVAAILDLELTVPSGAAVPDQPALPVSIDAPDGCTQFVAWELEAPADRPSSPWWLRRRLEVCGIRALDLVVDVTNYVLLELGQPLHAFDGDRLEGPELRARRATPGERLTTLDDVERTLEADDMVVADAGRAVAIGGVMGGADTEVGPTTTRVVLEAATWDAASVRRTSRRLGLASEASIRFAREVDPAIAEPALARAAELLADLADVRATGASRTGEPTREHAPVRLDPDWCAALLGVDDLGAERQAEYLRRLGCEVRSGDGALAVTAPSWRTDLGRPADLAEEVARLHGYDSIPATLPVTPVRGGLSVTQEAEREVNRLCRSFGLHEITTRPFVGAEAIDGLLVSDGRVRLANPLAQDAAALRPSLIEGLLGAVRTNVGQGRPGVGLFEAGRIFRPTGDPVEKALAPFGTRWRWRDPDGAALPTQPRTLGVAAQGLRHGEAWLDTEETWSVYDVLAVLDAVVSRLAPGLRLERHQDGIERRGWHPGRTAVLYLGDVEVGLVGQLHPTESARRDLPEPVVAGEVLLEPLLELATGDDQPAQAPSLTRHPAVTVDVALVADEQVPYAELERAVRRGAGELLDGLWWFDEYRGEQVGPGRRSLAMRLRLQAPDRQLSDEDAEAVIDAVAAEAAERGATLRR